MDIRELIIKAAVYLLCVMLSVLILFCGISFVAATLCLITEV